MEKEKVQEIQHKVYIYLRGEKHTSQSGISPWTWSSPCHLSCLTLVHATCFILFSASCIEGEEIPGDFIATFEIAYFGFPLGMIFLVGTVFPKKENSCFARLKFSKFFEGSLTEEYPGEAIDAMITQNMINCGVRWGVVTKYL